MNVRNEFDVFLDRIQFSVNLRDEAIADRNAKIAELEGKVSELDDKYFSLLARLTGRLLIEFPQIAKTLNEIVNAPSVPAFNSGNMAIVEAIKFLNEKSKTDLSNSLVYGSTTETKNNQ